MKNNQAEQTFKELIQRERVAPTETDNCPAATGMPAVSKICSANSELQYHVCMHRASVHSHHECACGLVWSLWTQEEPRTEAVNG